MYQVQLKQNISCDDQVHVTTHFMFQMTNVFTQYKFCPCLSKNEAQMFI
jgi:hypothetical protein